MLSKRTYPSLCKYVVNKFTDYTIFEHCYLSVKYSSCILLVEIAQIALF